MGVAGQGECRPRRHPREDVRLVGEEDERGVVGDLRERPLEVVGAAEVGHLRAEARQPEARALPRERRCPVLQHRNAGLREGAVPDVGAARDHVRILPPVVVADDGVDAEGGREPREDLNRVAGRHFVGNEAVAGGIVPEEDHKVRAQGHGFIDDVPEPGRGHGGWRHVDVGQGDDAQRHPLGPGGGRGAPDPANETEPRLDDRGIGARPGERQGRQGEGGEELASTDHSCPLCPGCPG